MSLAPAWFIEWERSEGMGEELWSQELRGGTHWSGVIRRGLTLRLTALGDNANVAALFYSHEQPLERYNMADTLKAQHTAHLSRRDGPWVGELTAGQTIRLLDLQGNQAVDTLFFARANPRERYDPQRTLRIVDLPGQPLPHAPAPCCTRTWAARCSRSSPTPAGGTTRWAAPVRRRATPCATRSTSATCTAAATASCCACLHDGPVDKRDIGANINFFMNVPVTPDGRADVRGRHLGARQVRRAARRDRRDRADLQLPAAEQPLQRVQPDAGAKCWWEQ
jgi:uncharacterized protein YcgI (DUF1989 family)